MVLSPDILLRPARGLALLRGQPWISGGCLAVALEYGGSAALHVFALRARYKFGYYGNEYNPGPVSDLGDIDMLALWVIVSSGCILMAPLLPWSSTTRKLGVRPILLYWGFLMYAELICTAIPIGSGFDRYTIIGQATCSVLPGMSDCDSKVAAELDSNYPQDWWGNACVKTNVPPWIQQRHLERMPAWFRLLFYLPRLLFSSKFTTTCCVSASLP